MGLPLLVLVALLLGGGTSAALIEQTWVISYGFVSADGVEKAAVLANGAYPGPTLRGRIGDRVRIRLVNDLTTETTSIHWHGVKQTGTPWADGTPGVTDCGIGPGQEYIYAFTLDKAGTLWWHSHSGFQKSTLQGMIIIEGDRALLPPHHDRNIPLMLNDYYHDSRTSMLAGLKLRLPTPFRWVGDAQSQLINGRGAFNCSATTYKCVQRTSQYIDVDEGQVYRVRIVGGTSLSHLNVGIDGHEMSVVEVETTLVRPLSVRYLDVGGGTSYSALLRTFTRHELDKSFPGHNGLFWVQVNVRHRPDGPQGLAILRYSFASRHPTAVPSRTVPQDTPRRDNVAWSLAQARALKSLRPVLVPPASRRIVLLGTQNRHADGSLLWAMNNVSHVGQSTPLQLAAYHRVSAETSRWVEVPAIPAPFNYNLTLSQAGLSINTRRATHVVRVPLGEVVEVVLQNTRALGGQQEIHPWHLHLHDFWVMGYGDYGSTWTAADTLRYAGSMAVERNTVLVYPQSWTAIRFRANNAGLAFFHCHIAAHLEMGMALAFQVGDAADIPKPPAGMATCGLVR